MRTWGRDLSILTDDLASKVPFGPIWIFFVLGPRFEDRSPIPFLLKGSLGFVAPCSIQYASFMNIIVFRHFSHHTTKNVISHGRFFIHISFLCSDNLRYEAYSNCLIYTCDLNLCSTRYNHAHLLLLPVNALVQTHIFALRKKKRMFQKTITRTLKHLKCTYTLRRKSTAVFWSSKLEGTIVLTIWCGASTSTAINECFLCANRDVVLRQQCFSQGYIGAMRNNAGMFLQYSDGGGCTFHPFPLRQPFSVWECTREHFRN